jgi:hypothetical protein
VPDSIKLSGKLTLSAPEPRREEGAGGEAVLKSSGCDNSVTPLAARGYNK